MALSKTLEFDGKILLVKEATPVEQLWCMAKLIDQPNSFELSNVWWSHKRFGCEYDPDTEKQIEKIDELVYNGLFTASACSDAPCKS